MERDASFKNPVQLLFTQSTLRAKTSLNESELQVETMPKVTNSQNDFPEQEEYHVKTVVYSRTYNLVYAWFCCFVMINVQISNTWARQAINSMYGYDDPATQGSPYYSIQAAVTGLNTESYGTLVGPCYSICFVPLLLFMGYLTD